MEMLKYIGEIQKQLVTKYKFPTNPEGYPKDVPDGTYPMEIDGKVDNVKIENGKITCCNFYD